MRGENYWDRMRVMGCEQRIKSPLCSYGQEGGHAIEVSGSSRLRALGEQTPHSFYLTKGFCCGIVGRKLRECPVWSFVDT